MGLTLQRISKGVRRRLARRESNHQIMDLASEVARQSPPAVTRPVVFFNASTRLSGMSLNAAYALLAGWSLRLSGTPVVHFACNMGLKPCVLGTDRIEPQVEPPCRECIQQAETLFSQSETEWFAFRPDPTLGAMLEGISLEALMRFEHEGAPLGELALPSLRWILRRHHLVDDIQTRYLLRQYILSAWGLIEQFDALLERVDPLAVVVFNGMFYPEAAARFAARRRGLRVISHEVGLQPYSGYFTTGDATAYPIHIPETFEMSLAQDRRLDEYLEQRFQGNFSMAGVRFWPEIRPLSPEFWERAGRFQQIVPVFTNVIFDTSQGHANVVFPHMFAWLDQVLEIVRAHPETYFVIRAHPDESRPGKKSLESVAGWVERNRVADLPNVLFVGPDEYFSSYELIQKSKFVMVYNSTIGLEATLLGAPVLCGGKARFTQLPTVFFPPTPQEYQRTAEEFLRAERIETPAEFRRNARRFLYYQLFRSSLPFGDYLQEDGFWKGYVTLKEFPLQALLPENSSTLRTVVNGILHDQPFLLED